MTWKRKALLSVIILSSLLAHAQGPPPWARARGLRPSDPPANEKSERVPAARLGIPVSQGNGCPEGSVSSTLSPDQKTLSILFDEFQAQVQPDLLVDRKMCRLRIPILVPRGYQVAIVKTDLRGFVDLSEGAQSRVQVVHQFQKKKGPKFQGPRFQREEEDEEMVDRRPFVQNLDFVGPASEEFLIGAHVESDVTWSPCGQSIALKIGAQIQVQAKTASSQALTVIDSLDVQGDTKKSMDYHLFWRSCR